MSTHTYQGSCHCGAAKFEADLDLSQGTGRCNCRLCVKIRNWTAMTKPTAIRVVAGEDQMTEYEVGGGIARHRFCKVCGVRLFAIGYLEQIGGDFGAVFVNALDGLAPEELAALPVKCADGRNDNWWNAPALTNYL